MMRRRTPEDLWKHGDVRAFEVDRALFARTGEALAMLRTYGEDGPLRTLMEAEGVAHVPVASSAWSFTASLPALFVSAGARDFGLGLYHDLWLTPWPVGRALLDARDAVCPAWMEQEPRLPWLIHDARAVLDACDHASPMDETRARRAIVRDIAMDRPREDEEDEALTELDDDDPTWDTLALSPAEASALARDLHRWRTAFDTLRRRFLRELAEIAGRGGAFVMVEEENLSL